MITSLRHAPDTFLSRLAPGLLRRVAPRLEVRTRFARTSEIDHAEKLRLYALYSTIYASTQEKFLRGFDKLTHVAIATIRGELAGFTSIDIRPVAHEGKEIVSIYFGNTAVARAHRSRGLMEGFVWRAIASAYWQYPLTPKYLFCHASTFRPYLFYAKKIRNAWPRVGKEAPPEVLAIRDTLIRNCPAQIGQDGWKSTKRVVWTMKDPSVGTREEHLADPDIRFFHSLNPTGEYGVYAFAPLTLDNIVGNVVDHLRGSRR